MLIVIKRPLTSLDGIPVVIKLLEERTLLKKKNILRLLPHGVSDKKPEYSNKRVFKYEFLKIYNKSDASYIIIIINNSFDYFIITFNLE